MKRRAFIWILLTAGVLLPPVHGRVFQGRSVPHGRLNTVGLPWTFAYSSRMQVDGQAMDLRVYSARFNEPVVEQLRSQFEAQGAEVELHRSADGAQGMARFDDREVRLLILSPRDQPNQMIFLFYPDMAPAADVRMPVADYPGAVSSRVVQNDRSGSICLSLSTADPPEQVIAFYTQTLKADGWRSALPSTTSSASMALFRKGERVCCVLAKRGDGALSRATVLVKGDGL